jgi:predicted nucleotidyltransferase
MAENMADDIIPVDVRNDILERLAAAERQHHVKVLLAVESGSRAWGFASPNSDYDARFIYVNRPEWYLSVGLEEQRDVIEYPIVDEIDINGWDLRKALRLFSKSNPAFVEWIQSPIVYRQHESFTQAVRNLLPQIYSCERGIYHYRSMAKTNYRGYLRTELVPLKKYFYVLRPLLAVRWLEQYDSPAPIEFSRLLSVISDQTTLIKAIDALLEIKRASLEMGLSPQIPEIHAFIEQELERLESVVPARDERKNVVEDLSCLFRHTLKEVWHNA